jgi:hypothetical protein
MPIVMSKIDSMQDALKKIKSHSETDVHEAVVFLCNTRSPIVPDTLLSFLRSPRTLFANSVELAVGNVVYYGNTDQVKQLQDIYDTTRNEDLAITIGKRLEMGASAPGLVVGPHDEIGQCIRCQSQMYDDSFNSEPSVVLEKLKSKLKTPEDKDMMLRVFANMAFEGELFDESSRQAASLRNSFALAKEWLAKDRPLSIESITRMVSGAINGFEILESWIEGLSTTSGGDKDRTKAAMVAAKGLLTKNVKALFSRGHPDTNLELSNDILLLLSKLPQGAAKYFGAELSNDIIATAPATGAKLQELLATPDEMFAYFKKNPMAFVDKIQAYLLDPNSSGIKDFQIKAIYDLLPKIYSRLDQGVVPSIWESGNEAVRLALLQSIGKNWPSNRLLSLYRDGTPQIKAAVAKILSDNKQGYLLTSNDGEM